MGRPRCQSGEDEFEAWGTAAQGIIGALFGAKSPALARWLALGERQSQLNQRGGAQRRQARRVLFGLIDYFHLAIGLMTEFEVAYRAGAPQPPGATRQFADRSGASTPAAAEPVPPAAGPPGSLALTAPGDLRVARGADRQPHRHAHPRARRRSRRLPARSSNK